MDGDGVAQLFHEDADGNDGFNIEPLLDDGLQEPLQNPIGPVVQQNQVQLSAGNYVDSFDPMSEDSTLDVVIKVTAINDIGVSKTGVPVATILGKIADGRLIQIKAWRGLATTMVTSCRINRIFSVDFLRAATIHKNYNGGDFSFEMIASSRTDFVDFGETNENPEEIHSIVLDDISNYVGKRISVRPYIQVPPKMKHDLQIGTVVHGTTKCIIEYRGEALNLVRGQRVEIIGRYRLPSSIIAVSISALPERLTLNDPLLFLTSTPSRRRMLP
ncbi:hypothetical protein M3Y98_00828400 [Aphelenchoides besseyi]|nr:hypothetical protein M3Y98_00828400 [Aphelenchoides besseyi]KAI6211440.1 hypothetical protein M3Y96_00434400 [Aphelenchoides besseyi]